MPFDFGQMEVENQFNGDGNDGSNQEVDEQEDIEFGHVLVPPLNNNEGELVEGQGENEEQAFNLFPAHIQNNEVDIVGVAVEPDVHSQSSIPDWPFSEGSSSGGATVFQTVSSPESDSSDEGLILQQRAPVCPSEKRVVPGFDALEAEEWYFISFHALSNYQQNASPVSDSGWANRCKDPKDRWGRTQNMKRFQRRKYYGSRLGDSHHCSRKRRAVSEPLPDTGSGLDVDLEQAANRIKLLTVSSSSGIGSSRKFRVMYDDSAMEVLESEAENDDLDHVGVARIDPSQSPSAA